MTTITEKYERIGIIKAGELLLSPKDAIDFAKELKQQKIPILGVDVWFYQEEKIVENPSSLDVSEISDSQVSADIAIQFITNQLPARTSFVSFVLDSQMN